MFPALLAAATAAVATPAAKATTLTLTPEQLKQLQLQAAQLPTHSAGWLAQHAPWATHLMAGIFVVAALLLIGLLAIQTTKNEGLGTIGGRVESAYRGRLGFDGQIARVTGFVATVFVIFATLISLSGI
ncbi:MAG: preprotein translocase subunit SecG [Candidatus Velthaea sp.]|jgi:protein translocase SecG subunit